jgi:hypothetical protein
MRLSLKSKKNFRVFLSLFLAFGPALIGADMARATNMTLEQAQAALVTAQQEVVDATASLSSATEAVTSSTVVRDNAQISYSEALASWSASRVTHPGTTSMASQNVVLNGTFDDASNWSNIGMGSNDTILNSSIPRVYNGVLIGSYVYHFVYQAGTFPSPTRQVTFSYNMSNNNTNDGTRPQADSYRVEFRTYNAAGQVLNYYDTRNRADSFPWTFFTATYNLNDDAVRWDVGFRMADNGYWNGNFAGSIDNVSVVTQVTTTSPETYTYGANETATKDSASQTLQSAQASLSSAVSAKTAAETRLATANAEVVRLTLLVAELTPHLKAPTNLVANIVGNNLELSWNAPEPSLSGVTPERYGVFWSTTNFTQNGWAIASTTTSITVPLSTIYSTAPQGSTFQFAIRADNDTLRIYSPRSTYSSVVTTVPNWWQISFDENQIVSISAPQGYVFDIPRAWYGDPNGPCGLDVSSSVSAFITNNSSASFTATNDNFTDPCPGTAKVLRLSTPIKTAPVLVVIPTPTPQPSPQPQPSPTETPSPEPEPTEQPTPEPTESQEPPVVVEPETPEPTEEPSPEPTPSPSDEPEPGPETSEPSPTPEPSPEEPLEEESQPEPTPTETETSEPEPSEEPEPTEEPSSTPEPESTDPEESIELKEEISSDNILALTEELANIEPTELTASQAEEIKEAALEVFESAEQGSPEYEAALEALLIVAQADDIVVDEELAAVPVVGAAVVALVDAFNALGNAGADMSPQVREQSEKVVIAAVIVGQVAMTATAAATSAAASAGRRP